MKKYCLLFLSIIFILSLNGCSPSTSQTSNTKPDSSLKATTGSDGIDIDLTQMSSTMIFSEVSNIVYQPENYVGKTVKIKGPFAVSTETNESNPIFAVIVKDATACCQNGLEFSWEGNHTYPNDYPPEGTEITVVGELQMYKKDGFSYTILKDSKVIFDKATS